MAFVVQIHPVADYSGTLRDSQSRLVVNPPVQETAQPVVRIGIAGSADVGVDATNRTVATQEVGELTQGKRFQLIETDERNLRSVPVIPVVLVLQLRKADLGSRGEAPGEVFPARLAFGRGIEFMGFVPQATRVFDLRALPAKDYRAEVLVVGMAQTFVEQAPSLAAASATTTDDNVSLAGSKGALWPRLRSDVMDLTHLILISPMTAALRLLAAAGCYNSD